MVILYLFISLDSQPSLVDGEINPSDCVLSGLNGTFKRPKQLTQLVNSRGVTPCHHLEYSVTYDTYYTLSIIYMI